MCRGLFGEDSKAPAHRVHDTLWDTCATTGRSDGRYAGDGFNGLVGGRRNYVTRRLGGVDEGEGRDGTDSRYSWRRRGTEENEVYTGTLENSLEDVWCPLEGKENDCTSREPDSMSSSDIIELETCIEANRIPCIVKIMNFVSDLPNSRPQGSI